MDEKSDEDWGPPKGSTIEETLHLPDLSYALRTLSNIVAIRRYIWSVKREYVCNWQEKSDQGSGPSFIWWWWDGARWSRPGDPLLDFSAILFSTCTGHRRVSTISVSNTQFKLFYSDNRAFESSLVQVRLSPSQRRPWYPVGLLIFNWTHSTTLFKSTASGGTALFLRGVLP